MRTPAALLALAALAASAHAQMTPVDATGWNRDIFIEATAVPPFAPTYGLPFDTPNNWAFYEQGLPGGTFGLPAGGSFTSLTNAPDGSSVQFQLQPYNAPNALFMASSAAATLTFLTAAQRPYNSLAICACSANGGGTGSVVVTFTDNSTSSFPYNAQEWFFVTTNNAITTLGRVQTLGNPPTFDDRSPEPRFHLTVLDLAAAGLSGKTVRSLAFTKPASAGQSVVVAISGLVNTNAPGVCCADTGACTVTTPSACTGSFQAGSTVCQPNNPCPQPIACCFPSGACTLLLVAPCASQGGLSGATGSVCNPNTCPQPTACCFLDGSCTLIQSATCTTQGGTFISGTTCNPNPCAQLPWACCLADGSCLDRTSAGCAALAGTWNPGSACTATLACFPPNLIVNPGAETADLSGWTIDLNGGSQWTATDTGVPIHSGMHGFGTSYGGGTCPAAPSDTRHQEIDLLAAGFTEAQLDASPLVVMGEWVAQRANNGTVTACTPGGAYFMHFELRDANHAPIAMAEFGNAAAMLQITANTPYAPQANNFTNYPPGVRFLYFTDGGTDNGFWAGPFGPAFDDAVAGVLIPRACCSAAGACTTADMATCITAGGTPQSANSTCTPSPCGAPTTGACCRGSTCAIVASTACTGANSRYAGNGAACNAAGNNTTPCCKADFNQNTQKTVQDIFDFLAAWFGINPYADFNGIGGITVQDIFSFLSAWFAGC